MVCTHIPLWETEAVARQTLPWSQGDFSGTGQQKLWELDHKAGDCQERKQGNSLQHEDQKKKIVWWALNQENRFVLPVLSEREMILEMSYSRICKKET